VEQSLNNAVASAYFGPHATIRADSYIMLASILSQPPPNKLMKVLASLDWDAAIPPDLADSLKALRQAASSYSAHVVGEEFNKLFVGLGSGEIVPYASWYRENKIQASPLASLRSDLMALGIVRQAEKHDYEDHAAALCEIMALISQDPCDVPFAAQAEFFQHHLAPWIIRFFKDLSLARSAAFYRIVALFGRSFLKYEDEYLKRGLNI
jgi:TorA maturation chaperone TorD